MSCISIESRYKNISASGIIFCDQMVASHVMYVVSLLSVPQNTGPPVITPNIHKLDG